MVKRKVRQKMKRMGRPVTVAAERTVTIRIPTHLLEAVDAWASANEATGKSEAIRQLLEKALK